MLSRNKFGQPQMRAGSLVLSWHKSHHSKRPSVRFIIIHLPAAGFDMPDPPDPPDQASRADIATAQQLVSDLMAELEIASVSLAALMRETDPSPLDPR